MAGLTIAKTFIKSPLFNPIALLVGFGISPPFANALAIGYLIGEHVLKKRFGAEWWNRYKGTALVGIACGYGIVAGVSAVLILISKALWYTYVGY